MHLIYDQLNNFSADEVSKFKFFELTLVGPTILWFNGMPNGALYHGRIYGIEFPDTLLSGRNDK